jgi:hypothetical protein
MRGVGKTAMATALVLGLAVSVAAAEEKDDWPKPASSGSGGWGGWFGGKDKPEAKKEAADRPAPGPSPAERAEVVRQLELKNYLRRIDVCDKLAQVAEDTNDQRLLSQVEEMKERVWAVYQQRTANLVSAGLPSETGGPAKPREAAAHKYAPGRRAPASQEEKP